MREYLIAYDRPTRRHNWSFLGTSYDVNDLIRHLRQRQSYMHAMLQWEPTWKDYEYRIVLTNEPYPPDELPKTWRGGDTTEKGVST